MSPRVLVSVPNTGWIHKYTTFAVIRLLQDPRYRSVFIAPTWRPYEHNLNRIAKDVVEQKFDFWLNIDADNPPIDNPLDLIELDRDVIGCATPIYHAAGDEYPICWNAMDKTAAGYRQHRPLEGLQEVDVIGSGCMLVARRVLLAVSPPWFVRETDGYGLVTRGPDFHFCDQVRAAGFGVWAHFNYLCRHFNEIELVEAAQAFATGGTPTRNLRGT